MANTTSILFFAIMLLCTGSMAMYGFDCTGSLTNVTTISLVDVGDCDIEKPVLNTTKKHVQLLQLNEFTMTKVLICSVKVTRVITDCGNMGSYAARVRNGEISYYKDLTRDECAGIHAHGEYTIQGTKISNVARNGTTNSPVTFAGSTTVDGKCHGSSYADDWGSYEDVIVAGWVEITLKDYYASVHLDSNKVRLQSGLACKLTGTSCVDYDGSHAFWDMLPVDTCGMK